MIQDYLGLSLDLSCDGELEKSESDLGNSVFVQNLSVSSDPEETEENDLGKSLSDVDVLGNSLCQEDNFDPMFTEFDSENLLSSTPVKKNSNTCNENEVEDLESVQAIIKSSPVERFILGE